MTEIILYDEKQANAVTLFNGDGLDPFIKGIKEVAENFEGDLTTEKGRKEIKSLAYKIGNAKNRVDEMRKKENEDHHEKIKANNEKGKKAWNDLEALQKKVRKPVTDWENADKERIATHQQQLALIEGMRQFADWQKFNASQIQTAINSVEDHFDREWGEFAFKAGTIRDQVIESLNNAIVSRDKYVADQIELEKLRIAEEEHKQKERDKRIAKEAVEAAKKEAAAKIEAEKQAAIRREAAIQKQKDQAERDKKAAEDALVKAREDAIEVAKLVAQRELEALEEAKRCRQEAVDRLQKEADDQKKKDADELAKREADIAHKNKIIKEIELAFIQQEGFPERMASLIAAAIAAGDIPHVTINY